jgi:hypothetical protein
MPPHQPKPRFLAPIGKPRDYVDRPELAVRDEPECVGPAILDSYAESAAFRFSQQHAVDVALAQQTRQHLAADDRVRDIQRRAKYAHVDMSHEVHLMHRDIERAKAGNRKPPARVLERLQGLESLLDGIAA